MNLESFITGMLGASTIEICASLAGFVSVYLVIKRNIWCWPVGLLQVALYVFVFYQVKLYSDMALHVIYIFMQLYGWWHWRKVQGGLGDIQVLPAKLRGILGWACVSLFGAMALGWLMQRYTDASFAYLDAFTTVTSLVAQWLLARRYISSWLFWIAVDLVAIYVYSQKALMPTAVLYTLFLFMAISGLIIWWCAWRTQVQATSWQTEPS